MSKKAFRASASSGRAAATFPNTAFGAGSEKAKFGSSTTSLSYLAEQPDLSTIQDPTLVVAFKNLSKKDATTKSKALEELQTNLSNLSRDVETADEAILDAWVKVYPRASIETSRRVRILSHTIHGLVFSIFGKRAARHMADVVGAWLAGQHDGDKAVTRAANDAFSTVFSTEEKRNAVFQKYHTHILSFCSTVVLNESVQSLSDERTTTPEDAEAKYNRVVASCISLLMDLLSKATPKDIENNQSSYDALLQSQKLWDQASAPDSSVRRSLYKLLTVVVVEKNNHFNLEPALAARPLLSKTAVKNQAGSSVDYSNSLLVLFSRSPSLWSSSMIAKIEPLSRLQQLIKRGSQGGSLRFWSNISELLLKAPDSFLPTTQEPAEALLDSILAGITRKDEPRTNATEGWKFFLGVFKRLLGQLSAGDAEHLRSTAGLSILRQYLNPNPEDGRWNITASNPHQVVSAVLRCQGMYEAAASCWSSLSSEFCDEIKTSAPEQSKSYEPSQSKIQTKGLRWFVLQSTFEKDGLPSIFQDAVNESTLHINESCMDQLVQRNGKPYGAAGVLEAALRQDIQRLLNIESLAPKLQTFSTAELPKLVLSPSQAPLITFLYSAKGQLWFEESWDSTMTAILESPEQGAKEQALVHLLSSPLIANEFTLPSSNTKLQRFITDDAEKAIQSQKEWSFLNSVLRLTPKVTSSVTDQEILVKLINALPTPSTQLQALNGLKTVTAQRSDVVKHFIATEEGQSLLKTLLLLSESQDATTSSTASEVKDKIELSALETGGETAISSVKHIIKDELATAKPDSLSIQSLLELAFKTVEAQGAESEKFVIKMLPEQDQWQSVLQDLGGKPPLKSLAISSLLGDLIHLLQTPIAQEAISRDNLGCAAPLRVAAFTTGILQKYNVFELLEARMQADLYTFLLLSFQVVNDHISAPTQSGVWYSTKPESESWALDFMTETQRLLNTWLRAISNPSALLPSSGDANFASIAHEKMLSNLDKSPSAFYHARGYAYSVSTIIDNLGLPTAVGPNIESLFKDSYKSANCERTAALIAGWAPALSQTATFSRFCNELIADLTGLNPEKQSSKCLEKLVLLNLSLPDQEHIIEGVAKPRLIRFIQHIIPWIRETNIEEPIQSQVWRLLSFVLPYVEDLYGEHWSDALSTLKELWSEKITISTTSANGTTLAVVHSSLKLLSALRPIAISEDSNDDLKEAWQDNSDGLASGALRLLSQFGELQMSTNQPLRIVNELLARQTLTLPLEKITNIGSLFALIDSPSEPVQKTAFTILHKRIPTLQEQVSFDAIIDKKEAKLPEELLSLLVQAPFASDFDATDFERAIPHSLRSYVSSWLLVFDHFKGASEKVKTDYENHIREGDYGNGLFDFVSEFLGHTRGKPVDASKFDVTTYSFDIVDLPYRDLQWLLMHLWYLSLKNVASVAKSWWIGCRNRQTSQSIESWTEKNFSSFLISETLAYVSEWEKTQDSSKDGALQMKINEKGKEVIASREVDDQMMAISIRLPSNYPLGQAKVIGLNRVAVDEKKWQSWLLNCEGVIRFTNGSIIDGLVSFRRNINGALEGQTECAICYSIVSSDKQLPTKKCSTCSNLFHGTCLYRWFKSSNSSSCPLCRNPFNYG